MIRPAEADLGGGCCGWPGAGKSLLDERPPAEIRELPADLAVLDGLADLRLLA
jgi:hypothetical protein